MKTRHPYFRGLPVEVNIGNTGSNNELQISQEISDSQKGNAKLLKNLDIFTVGMIGVTVVGLIFMIIFMVLGK